MDNKLFRLYQEESQNIGLYKSESRISYWISPILIIEL